MLRTQAGFVANQKLFIEAECQRFSALPNCNVVLDRGAEDIEFYSLHYPQLIGKDWSVGKSLRRELAALRSCRSNRILYLRASTATLTARKKKDTKRHRGWFEDYLRSLHYTEEQWFLSLSHTVCIDVDEMDTGQVEETVSVWLENEWAQMA